MIRAGIIGATGYTGIELLRLLQLHPSVKITQITSQTFADQDIGHLYPHLFNKVFQKAKAFDLNELITNCDVVFISLPHGHAAKCAQPLLDAGKKVIDLGPDFRLKNAADYQQWYNTPCAPESLLKEAVYGLPEVTSKDLIAKARLIANPGCNATAAIIAAKPLLQEKVIDPNDCIFDVKLGISGGGREPALKNHFCEVSENVISYGMAGTHRHTPEIEQELSLIAQKPIMVQFTPHMVPIVRGIVVAAHFKMLTPLSEDRIKDIFRRAYNSEEFIRFTPSKTAKIKFVRGTNFCDLSIHVDPRTHRVIVLSVIDNLIKGAGGQAIQNMNLMFGLPGATGLESLISPYP